MKQRFLIAILLAVAVLIGGGGWYVGFVNQTHPASWPMLQGDSLGRYSTRAVFPTEPALLWAYPIDDPTPSPPVIGADGTLYLHTPTQVVAVGSDGKRRWAWKSERDFGLLTLGRHGHLYVVGQQELVALDTEGRVKWRLPLPERSIQAPPIVGQGGVIYLATGRRLLAISSDGKVKWEYSRGPTSLWPVETPNGQVLVMTGGQLRALKPDGSEAWSVRLPFTGGGGALAVSQDGTIYYRGRDRLHAFDQAGRTQFEVAVSQAPGFNLALGDEAIQSGGSRYDSHGDLRWEVESVGPGGLTYIDAKGNVVMLAEVLGGDSLRLGMWGPDGAERWKLGGITVQSMPAIGPDGQICFAGRRDGETSSALICVGSR